MSTLEIIVEELKTMSPPMLEEASNYIHRLRENDRARRLAILRETSGILSPADAVVVEKAITDGCETLDAKCQI